MMLAELMTQMDSAQDAIKDTKLLMVLAFTQVSTVWFLLSKDAISGIGIVSPVINALNGGLLTLMEFARKYLLYVLHTKPTAFALHVTEVMILLKGFAFYLHFLPLLTEAAGLGTDLLVFNVL